MESDENRPVLAIEIGNRYLGIEDETDNHEEKSEKNDLNNLNSASTPKHNQTNEKIEGRSLSDSELVIDILNDELIALVRQKIKGKKSFGA